MYLCPSSLDLQLLVQSRIPLTHSPRFNFSMASSMAGWNMPFPRNVSMTCPYRKNTEKILSGMHEQRARNEYRQHKRGYQVVRKVNVRICKHDVGCPKDPTCFTWVPVRACRHDSPGHRIIQANDELSETIRWHTQLRIRRYVIRH